MSACVKLGGFSAPVGQFRLDIHRAEGRLHVWRDQVRIGSVGAQRRVSLAGVGVILDEQTGVPALEIVNRGEGVRVVIRVGVTVRGTVNDRRVGLIELLVNDIEGYGTQGQHVNDPGPRGLVVAECGSPDIGLLITDLESADGGFKRHVGAFELEVFLGVTGRLGRGRHRTAQGLVGIPALPVRLPPLLLQGVETGGEIQPLGHFECRLDSRPCVEKGAGCGIIFLCCARVSPIGAGQIILPAELHVQGGRRHAEGEDQPQRQQNDQKLLHGFPPEFLVWFLSPRAWGTPKTQTLSRLRLRPVFRRSGPGGEPRFIPQRPLQPRPGRSPPFIESRQNANIHCRRCQAPIFFTVNLFFFTNLLRITAKHGLQPLRFGLQTPYHQPVPRDGRISGGAGQGVRAP